jgi:hypothetical protein
MVNDEREQTLNQLLGMAHRRSGWAERSCMADAVENADRLRGTTATSRSDWIGRYPLQGEDRSAPGAARWGVMRRNWGWRSKTSDRADPGAFWPVAKG